MNNDAPEGIGRAMDEYKREEVLETEGLIRYFAYENNMCAKSMKRKCPEALILGVSRLPNHRFIINEQGMATVIPKAASAVYGILWLLAEEDEKMLDHYKKVDEGPYAKNIREIETPEGEKVKAMIYVSRNFMYGVPGQSYLDEILLNAERHKFPPNYLRELKRWAKTDRQEDTDETIVSPG